MTDPVVSAARSVPALRARGVSKAFSSVPALVDFDLDIEPGQVHALVGGNGSGKSTFIKILSGFHKPDAGKVEIGGEVLHAGRPHAAQALGCRFVHQDLGLIDALSAADNIFLGSKFPTRFMTVRHRYIRAEARRLFAFVGLSAQPAGQVGSLTQAEKTLVAVARAIRTDSTRSTRLLVLDEPTATLPANDVALLSDLVRRIAASGVGVLYVSHRLDEIFDLADVVTVLRDGHKRASCATAGLTRPGLVNLVVGDTFEEHAPPPAFTADTGAVRVTVSNLHTASLRGVSLRAAPGEIVGVAGITGSGRESLLRSIFSGDRADEGLVSVDGKTVPRGSPRASIAAGIAYLPPDRKALAGFMDMSARHNLMIADLSPFSRGGSLSRKQEGREAAKWLERLHVKPADGAERKLAIFSGGNQQKILFARWLRRDPRLLLVDEPTQGVDVAAKARLHHWLRQAAANGAAVIVSSADPDELAALGTRVLVMRNGLIAAAIEGDRLTSAAISAECIRVTQPAQQTQE